MTGATAMARVAGASRVTGVSRGPIARSLYFAMCCTLMVLSALQHYPHNGQFKQAREMWAFLFNMAGVLITIYGTISNALHRPTNHAADFLWVYVIFPTAYWWNNQVQVYTPAQVYEIDHLTFAATATFAGVFLELPLTVTTLACTLVIGPLFTSIEYQAHVRQHQRAVHYRQLASLQAQLVSQCSVSSLGSRACSLLEGPQHQMGLEEAASIAELPTHEPGSFLPRAALVISTCFVLNLVAQLLLNGRALLDRQQEQNLRHQAAQHEQQGAEKSIGQDTAGPAAVGLVQRTQQMCRHFLKSSQDAMTKFECSFYSMVLKWVNVSTMAAAVCVPIVLFTLTEAFMGMLYSQQHKDKKMHFSPSWVILSGICVAVMSRLDFGGMLSSLVEQQQRSQQMEAHLEDLRSTHAALLEERQALQAQLMAGYHPRATIDTGTPADKLLSLLRKLITGEAVPPLEDLLHLQNTLLAGCDVYQPTDLAAKLAASADDADVGMSLAVTLGQGTSRRLGRSTFSTSGHTTMHYSRAESHAGGGHAIGTPSRMSGPSQIMSHHDLRDDLLAMSQATTSVSTSIPQLDLQDDLGGSRLHSFTRQLQPLHESAADMFNDFAPAPGVEPVLRNVLQHIMTTQSAGQVSDGVSLSDGSTRSQSAGPLALVQAAREPLHSSFTDTSRPNSRPPSRLSSVVGLEVGQLWSRYNGNRGLDSSFSLSRAAVVGAHDIRSGVGSLLDVARGGSPTRPERTASRSIQRQRSSAQYVLQESASLNDTPGSSMNPPTMSSLVTQPAQASGGVAPGLMDDGPRQLQEEVVADLQFNTREPEVMDLEPRISFGLSVLAIAQQEEDRQGASATAQAKTSTNTAALLATEACSKATEHMQASRQLILNSAAQLMSNSTRPELQDQAQSSDHVEDRSDERLTTQCQWAVSPSGALLDQVEQMLAQVDDWEFNAFALADITQGHPLSTLAFFLFNRSGLISDFGMDAWTLSRYLCHIEAGYLDNPYHNKTHAMHVLHRMHMLLHYGGFMPLYADNLTLLGCYLAAIIHDFEHLGITNDFLINTQDPLAILYNDRAPLENHHLAASWALLRQPKFNFLSSLVRAQFDGLRKLVIELVLATDMKMHFSLLSQFNALHGSSTRQTNKLSAIGSSPTGKTAQAPNSGSQLHPAGPSNTHRLVHVSESGSVGTGPGSKLNAQPSGAHHVRGSSAECVNVDEPGVGQAGADGAAAHGTLSKSMLSRLDNSAAHNATGSIPASPLAGSPRCNSATSSASGCSRPSAVFTGDGPASMSTQKSFRLAPVDENDRILSLQLAVKAADICNLCDPPDTHFTWIRMLEEEFFRQGDLERELGMTISPLFDRNKPGVSKSQVAFMDIVAVPLFRSLASVFPGSEPLLKGLLSNYNHWVEEKTQREARERGEGQDGQEAGSGALSVRGADE